ncbi:hypothetical protein CDAR_221981 [Caerostris darwini]|uniref:Uncharacterized protein n=1 Tax=Caerostris darwini TaxID=1538125 RepID=A0AAV4VIX7_9ARAC|nr:hypothetical protein CDAR_221981 [Caerostris darwini]
MLNHLSARAFQRFVLHQDRGPIVRVVSIQITYFLKSAFGMAARWREGVRSRKQFNDVLQKTRNIDFIVTISKSRYQCQYSKVNLKEEKSKTVNNCFSFH